LGEGKNPRRHTEGRSASRPLLTILSSCIKKVTHHHHQTRRKKEAYKSLKDKYRGSSIPNQTLGAKSVRTVKDREGLGEWDKEGGLLRCSGARVWGVSQKSCGLRVL